MTILTEGRHAAEFVMSEASRSRSRDTLLIAASQDFVAGGVLGENAGAGLEAASAAKAGGNTGNGALTLDATAPIQPGAKHGVYVVRCITAAANGGTFRVEDPNGNVLGDVAVGATFSDDIKFVIADGATDFIVGDGFDITVSAQDDGDVGQFGALNVAATNGLAAAAAIALYAATTGVGETTKIAGIRRDAEVNGKLLTWPAGITADQKAAAIAQLAERGIIVR